MGTTASVAKANPRNIPTKSATHVIPSISADTPSEMLEPNILRSDWMAASVLANHLERGDLVEIRRSGKTYSHWVVYIGLVRDTQCVVHISTDTIETPTAKEFKAKVRSDPFSAVVGTDLCRINNSLDASRRPFPPSVIVERAINKLGTGGYHIVRNNCEHFAKWCRYALRESDQSLLGQAGAVGLASLMATASVPYSLAIGTFGFAIMKVGQAVSRRYIMRSII